MIPPHSSCRYALLTDYLIVAVHSLSPEGDEALVSDALPHPGGMAFGKPRLIFTHTSVLYFHPNYKAAAATRQQLQEQDREWEAKR